MPAPPGPPPLCWRGTPWQAGPPATCKPSHATTAGPTKPLSQVPGRERGGHQRSVPPAQPGRAGAAEGGGAHPERPPVLGTRAHGRQATCPGPLCRSCADAGLSGLLKPRARPMCQEGDEATKCRPSRRGRGEARVRSHAGLSGPRPEPWRPSSHADRSPQGQAGSPRVSIWDLPSLS